MKQLVTRVKLNYSMIYIIVTMIIRTSLLAFDERTAAKLFIDLWRKMKISHFSGNREIKLNNYAFCEATFYIWTESVQICGREKCVENNFRK